MNTFTNHKGTNKNTARNIMVHAIHNSETKNYKILSLPAEHFEIEKTIYQDVSRKYRYVMCERDELTFDKLKRNIKKLKTKYFVGKTPSLYFGSIGDIILNANKGEYSHLILDYCGQIGTFHEELRHTFRNDIIEVGGTLSLTFNKRITPGPSTIFCNTIDKLNSYQIPKGQDNGKTMRVIKTFINREGGYKYDIENIFEYLDNNDGAKKGAAMVLVVVRRIK